MPEVLTVLTFKSAAHIIGDGGTESWKISPGRAGRCAYVVCVRHQQGPYKAEGDEPHKHAFLVGKVSGVAPSRETADRFRVEMSEYAIIDGPKVPLDSASPTQYFPSLSSAGINEAALQWRPISNAPHQGANQLPKDAHTTEDGLRDGRDGEDIVPMSVFMQAKKLVADSLHVPLSAVEIIVRT